MKKRSGEVFFWALYIFVSLLWGFCLYKLSLWWKDLTESVLVSCRPGFPVVGHVGRWHFWIWEWSLELCWNSCVNNNSSCCSSWHGNNSYNCSCGSNRNHRKARNSFWLHSQWLPLCCRRFLIRAHGYLKSKEVWATELMVPSLLDSHLCSVQGAGCWHKSM